MLDALSDHLWQSTLFGGAVAVLTLAFRRNPARVRYWLWLAASVKFLIPFSVLLWIGGQMEIVPLERSGQTIVGILDNAATPFTQPPPERMDRRGRPVPPAPPSDLAVNALRSFTLLWPAGSIVLMLVWAARWRRVATCVREASDITDGRVLQSLRRLAGDVRLRLVSSPEPVEPGVFGLASPVLIWPAGIASHLTDAQVDAILLHEVAHARRRDNLTAMIHMAVEALFWFHPLVWWIGARLVDERERACDEDVIGRGTEPHVYAESILKTCQFSIESPLVCVAGVTGSDLKKRVEQIMRRDAHVALSAAKRFSLWAAAVAAVAIPVAIGIITSPRLAAQIAAPAADAPTFDVASIKPSAGGGRVGGIGTPGRVNLTGMTVRRLITQAYDIHDSQIIGGPDWLRAEGYDITATLSGTASPEARRMMMQTLLRDRFKLMFHSEKRDLPIYALVVARSEGRLGPGLKRIPDDECPPGGPRRGGPPAGAPPLDPNAAPQVPCGALMFAPGRLRAHGVPIDNLARSLGALPAITSFNRPVTNLTRLEGLYDLEFTFSNDFAPGGASPAGGAAAANPGDEPALFTALQEQLGLKLNPQRATLDVLVIDSIERPSEN